MRVALAAAGLTVARGSTVAVQQVSLQLKAGEWLALVGPNGAGKSSLLSAMAGLLPVAAGRCELQGRAWADWRRSERARVLAWLGQGNLHDDAMSVHDTVALGRWPHRLAWRQWVSGGLSPHDERVVRQALDDTELGWAADRPMGALSGGEQRRAHLARVLATAAPVWLLDEPMAHLDAPHQRTLAACLRRHVARGGAVLSALHELPWALQADRVAVLEAGQLLACEAPGAPALHGALARVFKGAVKVHQIDGHWTALPVPIAQEGPCSATQCVLDAQA